MVRGMFSVLPVWKSVWSGRRSDSEVVAQALLPVPAACVAWVIREETTCQRVEVVGLVVTIGFADYWWWGNGWHRQECLCYRYVPGHGDELLREKPSALAS